MANVSNYMEQGGSIWVVGGELQLASGATLTAAGTQASNIADATALTENAGAIGGTNDGDLPNYGSAPAALTENAGAIGGTNDGDLPDLTTPDANSNAAAVRELATKVNEIASDVGNLIAGDRELATKVNTLTTKLNSILTALENVGILASS